MIRRGIHDGIHITASQHLAEVIVAVRLRQLCQFHRSIPMLSIDIADGHDLHAFIREEGPQIARALSTNTDAGETDLAIRRNSTCPPEHGSRKDQRSGGLEKLAA
jgi:hypothetical protein